MPAVLGKVSTELSPRELDVALYNHIAHQDKAQQDGKQQANLLLLDVSQSIHRVPAGLDMAPTVTPGGRLVALPRDGPARLVRGFECLRLQVLHTDLLSSQQQAAARSFTQKQLQSLAGNAFSGPHVSICLLYTSPSPRD